MIALRSLVFCQVSEILAELLSFDSHDFLVGIIAPLYSRGD